MMCRDMQALFIYANVTIICAWTRYCDVLH